LQRVSGSGKYGAGTHGVGWTKEHDHRDSERIGEVHPARIVGDQQMAGLEACDVGGEIRLAGQVLDARRVEACGNDVGDRAVSLGPEEGEVDLG
jgi:hypothetical protein